MTLYLHSLFRFIGYGSIISFFLIIGQVQAKTLSSYNAKKVQYSNQLQQKGELAEAISILAELSPSAAYDRAYIARVLGVFYWQNEQSKQAIFQLSAAISLHALEQQAQWQTEKMLADIYYSDHQWSKAIEHYQHLLVSRYPVRTDKQSKELATSKNEIHLRLANSYYQDQSWKSCLTHIRQFKPKNRNEKIQKLKIQLVSELQLTRWSSAERTAQALIVYEPNQKIWWQQLIAAQLQQQQADKALVNYSLAKQQGIQFEVQDYKILSQLYSQNRLPEQAAKVMEEMFINSPSTKSESELVRQATYWQMAKEWGKAEEAWGSAAKESTKHYWSLAKLQLQQKAYQQALKSTEKAKSVILDSDYRLMKVRLYYKLGGFNDALSEAKKLNELYPSKEAKDWISYLTHKV